MSEKVENSKMVAIRPLIARSLCVSIDIVGMMVRVAKTHQFSERCIKWNNAMKKAPEAVRDLFDELNDPEIGLELTKGRGRSAKDRPFKNRDEIFDHLRARGDFWSYVADALTGASHPIFGWGIQEAWIAKLIEKRMEERSLSKEQAIRQLSRELKNEEGELISESTLRKQLKRVRDKVSRYEEKN